ncbi:MAG: DUF3885 domain-containing protein [Chitinophagaceae bacterium]|nr:MAG: DUF3885 domain-containing protein [Chitinophagaceae bacterium]
MNLPLQTYLAETFPGWDILSPYSAGTKYRIRFELGGGFDNGTPERIRTSSDRACTIFQSLFTGEKLWLLCYEDGIADHGGLRSRYLYQQVPVEAWRAFAANDLSLNSGSFETDGLGNSREEKYEATVVCGAVKRDQLHVRKILTGIAGNEMGQDQRVDQRVHFLDTQAGSWFFMYDDRGCYAGSNHPEKMQHLVDAYAGWIAEGPGG